MERLPEELPLLRTADEDDPERTAELPEERTALWAELRDGAVLLAVSILICSPAVVDFGKRWLNKLPVLRYCAVLGLLFLCLAALTKSTYNPFLYFRF